MVGLGDQPRESRSCCFDDLNSVIGIGSAQHRANRRTVDEERVGRRRRSLHIGPSITADQLRQRAEAVKADPFLRKAKKTNILYALGGNWVTRR